MDTTTPPAQDQPPSPPTLPNTPSKEVNTNQKRYTLIPFLFLPALLLLFFLYNVLAGFFGFGGTNITLPEPSLAPSPKQPTPSQEPANEVTMCTMDARECPDGSFVGRSGPNCEFVCPDGSKSK